MTLRKSDFARHTTYRRSSKIVKEEHVVVRVEYHRRREENEREDSEGGSCEDDPCPRVLNSLCWWNSFACTFVCLSANSRNERVAREMRESQIVGKNPFAFQIIKFMNSSSGYEPGIARQWEEWRALHRQSLNRRRKLRWSGWWKMHSSRKLATEQRFFLIAKTNKKNCIHVRRSFRSFFKAIDSTTTYTPVRVRIAVAIVDVCSTLRPESTQLYIFWWRKNTNRDSHDAEANRAEYQIWNISDSKEQHYRTHKCKKKCHGIWKGMMKEPARNNNIMFRKGNLVHGERSHGHHCQRARDVRRYR